MMNLLFSPNGRIDQPTYWRAVLILAAISMLLWVLSAFVNPLIFMLGAIFWWPWIAVHVKRFHDAGKSGWLTLATFAAAVVLYYVLGFVLAMIFGGNAQQNLEIQRQMQEAQVDQDIDAIFDAFKQLVGSLLVIMILIIAGLTGILGVIMGLFKTEPNDNQHGPGPLGTSVAFT
jgi:uncharacterized membrane protein YhaH (DUF805 family)